MYLIILISFCGIAVKCILSTFNLNMHNLPLVRIAKQKHGSLINLSKKIGGDRLNAEEFILSKQQIMHISVGITYCTLLLKSDIQSRHHSKRRDTPKAKCLY